MNKHTDKGIKDQSGQTLVEFILLLAAITIISFSFLRITNGLIIDRWENISNLILEDETQDLKIQ